MINIIQKEDPRLQSGHLPTLPEFIIVSVADKTVETLAVFVLYLRL